MLLDYNTAGCKNYLFTQIYLEKLEGKKIKAHTLQKN